MQVPEVPPPYSGDTQKWAEDISDYLLRNFLRLLSETGATGVLPDGTADSQSLRWDDADQEWQATSTFKIGDSEVQGVASGAGVTQNVTRLEVVSSMPGTPDPNTIYFVT